jgi:hypothetical protein
MFHYKRRNRLGELDSGCGGARTRGFWMLRLPFQGLEKVEEGQHLGSG